MAIRDPESITVNENIPGNILQRLIDLENRFNDYLLLDDPTIEEVTDGRTGVFDLMISPAEGILVTDPTDVGYTGYFIAGNGLEFDGNNYVAGNVVLGEIKTGFTDAGTLYAIDAVIEGEIIIGPGSEAGGWLIDATRIYNSDIQLDSSIPAILIGDASAIMTGAGVFMGNDGGTYKLRIGDPADNYLLWDGTTLATAGQWIQSAGMNPALQEWQTNIVFSSASDVQVNWTSGTIVLSDGTTYSISSGNTGTMAALTYIYLDIAVSLTVLQTTTTYSTATGDGKILVAAAQNHTAGASVLPFGGQQPLINGGVQITALSILAGNIAAGAITATKISVTSLSAITANMGALTIDGLLTMSGASGAITIGTTPPSSATVGTGLWVDRTGVYSLSSNVQQATLTSAGLTAAGTVFLNDEGLSIATGTSDVNNLKFVDGSTTVFFMQVNPTGSEIQSVIRTLPITGNDSRIQIASHVPTSSESNNIELVNVVNSVTTNSMFFGDLITAFNNSGNDINFRVSTENVTDTLFIDGGLDAVGIGGTPSSGEILSVNSALADKDINMYGTAAVALTKHDAGLNRFYINGLSNGVSAFDHFNNAGNTGTGEDDLYSDTFAADQFAIDGDKFEAHYSGLIVGHATATRQIRAYFGGTLVFDSGAVTEATNAVWLMDIYGIRVSATLTRVTVRFQRRITLSAINYTLVTATLSNAQILKITGEAAGAGAANNDILARHGHVLYMPAAV